jgi:class 3 adenylate cyclase
MRCPSCQQENPAGARFCLACGGRLAAACEACGALLPDEARFCPQCGRATAARAGGARGPSPAAAASPAVAAVPDLTASPTAYTPPHLTAKILSSRAALEGERKPVTVLFCDVAGSTGLAERLGPDAMHDLFNRFFAAALAEVHRYEGTVNQFLGDGFMALFGAPVAHEDHARRAVLAALAIRRAFTDRPLELDTGLPVRLTLRMGLNTGIVVSAPSATTSGWTTRRWATRPIGRRASSSSRRPARSCWPARPRAWSMATRRSSRAAPPRSAGSRRRSWSTA